MRFRQVLFFTWILLAFILSACGGQDPQAAIATGIAQTMQISELQTAAAGGGGSGGQAQATDTPQPAEPESPTDTPTITLTPTPSTPYVSVSTDTNCRTGPRVDYSYVTTIAAGVEVEVVATFPGADYVIVRRPDSSGLCWLWLRYANQSDFTAYNLPVATQPPTSTPTNTPSPTPAFVWAATWNMWVGGAPYTVTLSVSGNSLSGSFPASGETVTLNGTISNHGQNASGTWTSTGGTNGTFQWQIKSGNLNQFIGNYNGGSDSWCGAKNGASQPSPCQWP